MKSRKFIDTAVMQARAGKGGDGAVSFRREKFVEFGGPDGGDGGKGGSVIIVGDEDTDSLVSIYFEPRRFAQHGGKGTGRGMHGKNGSDVVVPVPLGTIAKDETTGDEFGEITVHGQRLVIAKGGRGGWGNIHWKRADHQVPMEFTPGKEGEEFNVRLDLRVMADAGLVGFPSAGKSSLLARISAARPKVAAYHFTTLNPIIGTVVLPEKFTSFRVADIPGIIRDAHLGVGLGLEFLRHIERSKALVFVIDMGGVEGRDPADDYAILRAELEARDPALLEREQVVVATKMDLPDAKENLKKFRKDTGTRPIETSAIDGTGFDKLVTRLVRIIKPQPRVNGRPPVTLEVERPREPGKSKRDTGLRYAAARKQRERKVRKGCTPPYEIQGRGENPGADEVVSEKKQKFAGFLKL